VFTHKFSFTCSTGASGSGRITFLPKVVNSLCCFAHVNSNVYDTNPGSPDLNTASNGSYLPGAPGAIVTRPNIDYTAD
jgi:hypothetical protein